MRRVLVDTNVIVSALIFPHSTPARVFQIVIEKESLALTGWILNELREVIARKWPDRRDALETLLRDLVYELLPSGEGGPVLRDPDDQPILDAALAAEVDIIVTGDKDFLALQLERPKILTPRDYLEQHAPLG